MTAFQPTLVDLIRVGGVLQLAMLLASAVTPLVFDWKKELATLNPFLRKLFWVYGAFIMLTYAGFGLIALTLAPDLASGAPLARALAGLIAAFWLLRLLVGFFVYDLKPYVKSRFLRAGAHGLQIMFLYFTVVFGAAAMGQ